MTSFACSVDGCERPTETVGYCGAHYQRVRTTGSPGSARVRPRYSTLEAAFAAYAKPQDGHLIWTGPMMNMGYGVMSMRGVKWLAHRYSYTRTYGPIPDGLYVDHICHVPACVKPEHLRLVTAKQNQEHRLPVDRGVFFDRGKYVGYVTHNRKRLYLGRFVNKEDAVAAVVAKRLELFTHNDADRAA